MKHMVDEETDHKTWMPSKMGSKMNAWGSYISHKIEVSKELDANFNIPKIHFMTQWVERIHSSRPLEQSPTDSHKHAHILNLRDCWNAHSHHLSYMPPSITLQRSILCFKIREANLEFLAEHQEIGPTTSKILPSGADLTATQSSQSDSQGTLLGHPNFHDG
jgi:hypothetical protein